MNKAWRVAAIVSTVAGCGGGSDGGGAADMSMAPPADMTPAGPEVCKTDNQPVALGAHYGVEAKLLVHVSIPALFDQDATSTLLLLADIADNGRTVTVHPCHIDIPKVALPVKNTPPVVLTASDALVQSLKAIQSTATLGGNTTCASFDSDPLAIVIGAHLAMPSTDPLPSYVANAMPPVKLCGGMASVTCDATMDDGCICDQDADGKPGATVSASGLPSLDDVDEVYLALRTVVSLDGMVFPPTMGQLTAGQRLKGKVAGLKLEQSPVGCRQTPAGGGGTHQDCSDMIVKAVAGLNPTITPSQSGDSPFVAMPVPDGETCQQLVTDAPTLFKGQF